MEPEHDPPGSDATSGLEFEWHAAKAAENLQKHRVSFQDAMTIFGDERHIEVPDRDHSDDEVRYLAIGRSERGRLLTVIFTERGSKLRLISARLAESWERRVYESADE
ncbi:MAG: BrnT family toxin [Acidobacteriota bacterium]